MIHHGLVITRRHKVREIFSDQHSACAFLCIGSWVRSFVYVQQNIYLNRPHFKCLKECRVKAIEMLLLFLVTKPRFDTRWVC